MSESRLPFKVATQLIKLGIGWAKDVKEICIQAGYPTEWTSMDADRWKNVLPQMKINLYDLEIMQIRQAALKWMVKYNQHLIDTHVFRCAEYLSREIPFQWKKVITLLRCSALPLNATSTAYEDEKNCTICNLKEAEDNAHFLTKCPVYHSLRLTYLKGLSFTQILNNCNYKNVALFIINALRLRKCIMEI